MMAGLYKPTKSRLNMIQLPDFHNAFDYENDFYLSCDASRLAKFLAHFQLLEKTSAIDGTIVECGVFKGASFSRFAMFRKILNLEKKRLVGFDTFNRFPETDFEKDKGLRSRFIEFAGELSISTSQLMEVLQNKECAENVELVDGDITKTVPNFAQRNADIKISLLNLDVDIYEPTVTILEHLFPLITPGGILILDDYNSFPGETLAVDNYIKGKQVEIREPIIPGTPHYIVKREDCG
jgi:hypothetical protein